MRTETRSKFEFPIRTREFPVPLRTEFYYRPLNSLADWARRQVGELIMRTVTRSLGLAACACVVASLITVRAEQSCAPKTNAAKILRTKNLNDVDLNWAPPAFIGLSWSLIETKQEGIFLRGVLVNPRGGILPGRDFVIASEWDCG
jgi:hypothetical protein